MTDNLVTPELQLFGNLVDLDCHIQDLKLVLKKTEEIEFPDHEELVEGEALIAEIFPDITRKSFITTLVIALDDQFKVFCEIAREATGQTLKWTDIKGSPLERFLAYSKKLCGITPLCDDSITKKIMGLIEVRNCIVHNNSSLEGFSKRKVIESFAKQMPGLNIQETLIVLDVGACNSCADLVLQFMEQAYESALRQSGSDNRSKTDPGFPAREYLGKREQQDA